MSDVKCMKCNAETVPIGNDPEYGVIYQCLHNADHRLVVIADNVHRMWTVERPRGESECQVFRCMAMPSRGYATDRPGRRIVFMGEDYLIAKRRQGGLL